MATHVPGINSFIPELFLFFSVETVIWKYHAAFILQVIIYICLIVRFELPPQTTFPIAKLFIFHIIAQIMTTNA